MLNTKPVVRFKSDNKDKPVHLEGPQDHTLRFVQEPISPGPIATCIGWLATALGVVTVIKPDIPIYPEIINKEFRLFFGLDVAFVSFLFSLPGTVRLLKKIIKKEND